MLNGDGADRSEEIMTREESREHMERRTGNLAKPRAIARVDSSGVGRVRRSEDMVRSSKEADKYEAELVRRAMKSEQAARIERELRRPAYDANWLFMDEGEMAGEVAAQESGS